MMTRKQWEHLNQAISTAIALSTTRIEDLKRSDWDASMYEGWLENAKTAQKVLVDLAIQIPYQVWYAEEEAA